MAEISANYAMDDTFQWTIVMSGPPGTHYEGGTFLIDATFPTNYPFKPPQLRFCTTTFHTQIDPTGKVSDLDILDNWNPGMSMRDVMVKLIEMMKNPKPMPRYYSPASKLFHEDPPMYDYYCMHYTEKHAK